MVNWTERGRAAGIHFGLSVAIAGIAALLVFGIWYPYPYREISGGRELFLLVVSVDVVMGPLITLAVFDRRKGWTKLRMDLGFIVLMQVAALWYGLWTVYVARPVHLVFEVDRFRVVHAVEVPEQLLEKKPADVEAMPLTGPTLLAVRAFKDSNEGADAALAELGGAYVAARPDFWRPYAQARSEVLKTAKPVDELKRRFPSQTAEVDKVLAASGRKPAELGYLPMVGRKTFWTAFVDRTTADVVGFMPLDSF